MIFTYIVHVQCINVSGYAEHRKECSKRQPTLSLRHSAYPHQPYVDTLYVLPPCQCRPKLVLTGTSIPLYIVHDCGLSLQEAHREASEAVMDFSSLPVDSSGQYHIQRSFLKPRLRSQKGWQDVTMVTHCTVNHLHYLLDLSEHWQGPIAVGKGGISISNSLKGNIKLTASLCSYIVLKPSSHIVFDGSTVLQYPCTTIWKHSDQILNTGKYLNTIKY